MKIKKNIINLLKPTKLFFIQIANSLNSTSLYLQVFSRELIRIINRKAANDESEYFATNRINLLKKIKAIRKRQKREYPHYSYFHNYPYQAFTTLGVFGNRSTEERFDLYKLGEYVKSDHKLLDIGCNCGFMGIYTSYRTGCSVDGIDINPFAIEIGNLCVDYLKLHKKVSLETCRVQDLGKDQNYDAIFSFATHWTDDSNYRVPLEDHFAFLENFIKPDGIIFFESHCTDVGDEEFYTSIKAMENKFNTIYQADIDSGSRHYYIFQKISA
jgi:2-polyprenyl-3-methyl-5-hydroxy-6-metoxy-1,4-benzoquinol methylase